MKTRSKNDLRSSIEEACAAAVRRLHGILLDENASNAEVIKAASLILAQLPEKTPETGGDFEICLKQPE